MNKKRIKLLGLFGVLAIVGTASATWVFSKNAESNPYKIKINIEGCSQTGEIKVTDNGSKVELNLDQGEGSSNGITWKNGSGSAEGISAKYSSDAVIDESKIERTWTLTLSSGLLAYLDYPSTGYSNVAWTDDAVIALPQLVWKTNKKPNTLEQYNAMKGELANFEATIVFYVKLKNS